MNTLVKSQIKILVNKAVEEAFGREMMKIRASLLPLVSKEEQREIVEKTIPEWRIMLGSAERDLTHAEMLNRDYYRGRFASFINGQWIYNWEDKPIDI